jgi:peptidoglycan hydrolase-like protein with peptidoglycan-binding domain
MPHFEHNSEKFGYINLESLDGVQKALKGLGLNPGAIDGKDGPNTQRAVREFQASQSIKIDGIVGPETRQSLVTELQRQSETNSPTATS